MKYKFKLLVLITCFAAIILFIKSGYLEVLALQINQSNTVITEVGTPSGPKPSPENPLPTSIPVTSSTTISCPLSQDGNGSFNITCGTAKNHSSNNCGHGDPPYYPTCKNPPYAICPYSDQLKAAIDLRPAGSNGSNVPVYLPYIEGESVDWTKFSGPITLNGGSWGIKLEYTTSLKDKQYLLDLTHLDRDYITSASKSGEKVGVTKAGVDSDGGHLHTAISIDRVWLDAISEAHLCTP